MLILPIKKKWFDMILSGKKKEEYREIKPYYISRFEKEFFNRKLTIDEVNSLCHGYTLPTEIIFRNGYRKDSPYVKCYCRLTVGKGKEEWGAEQNKEYFILKLEE